MPKGPRRAIISVKINPKGLCMRRRELITLLGGAVAAWPLAARAQQPAKIPRMGILSPLSPSAIAARPFETLRAALGDLGYVEGKSIGFVYRWADGSRERLAG